MRKKTFWTFLLILIAFTVSGYAQQIDRISTKCPSPNNRTFASILATGAGNIVHTPCPTKASIFTGIVDFSGATITFGNLAADRFLAGNGSAALPSFTFTNSPTTGFYRVGADTFGVSLAGSQKWLFSGNDLTATGTTPIFTSSSDLTIGATTNLTVAGTDQTTVGNGLNTILLDNGSNNISAAAGNQISIAANTNLVVSAGGTGTIDTTGDLALRNGTTAGALFTATGGLAGVYLGDLTFGAGGFLDVPVAGEATLAGSTGTQLGNNPTSIEVETASDTLFTTASIWDLSGATGVVNFKLQRTITAGGTTGDQVINLPAGTVNLAAAATAITVTNSTVTANSIISVMARTNDATCAVKNYVPTAGSFTINMTAGCTAETSVGFIVTN